MDLIIGGAYQGKQNYAETAFAIQKEDICICTPECEPDFSRRCLVHFEQYVLYCLRTGKTYSPSLRKDAVIVAEDIFCGVVSVEEEIRLWREETGRALTALALQSDTVTRVFCGLPLRMKEKAQKDRGSLA